MNIYQHINTKHRTRWPFSSNDYYAIICLLFGSRATNKCFAQAFLSHFVRLPILLSQASEPEQTSERLDEEVHFWAQVPQRRLVLQANFVLGKVRLWMAAAIIIKGQGVKSSRKWLKCRKSGGASVESLRKSFKFEAFCFLRATSRQLSQASGI